MNIVRLLVCLLIVFVFVKLLIDGIGIIKKCRKTFRVTERIWPPLQ